MEIKKREIDLKLIFIIYWTHFYDWEKWPISKIYVYRRASL